MAKPRIFVSSTFYDLKHIRASLENFIETLGYEPILSEKGSIPYSHDQPLDESCYKEVHSSDIFVMIIGGRYGSEKSATRRKDRSRNAFELYDSVTKEELNTALEKDIPVYIFIEKSVYADYETYLQNPDIKSIKYAHVDSINTLTLIEEILKLPRNNPVYQFERYGEIENWLKTQWAGKFKDLLNSKSEKAQLASLQGQVEALSANNKTLQSYLEKIITKLNPDQSEGIIKSENKQLQSAKLEAIYRNSEDFGHMIRGHKLNTEQATEIIRTSKSINEIREKIEKELYESCGIGLRVSSKEINSIRNILGLESFEESGNKIEDLNKSLLRAYLKTEKIQSEISLLENEKNAIETEEARQAVTKKIMELRKTLRVYRSQIQTLQKEINEARKKGR